MTCERCEHLHVPTGKVCECLCHASNTGVTWTNYTDYTPSNVTLQCDGTCS